MTIGIKEMAISVGVLGVKSFILGIIAENKKLASGIPLSSGGVVTCKYPSDPTVFLGFLSIISLAASVMVGFYAVFYPYNGKSVPRNVFFRDTKFSVFFNIAVWLSLLAEGMLLWPTITELIHLKRNVHHNMNAKCPTAKTGLFGGAAFMALNASLFWLICLMLANNAREDYFDEEDENRKGEYGQIFTTDYDAKGQGGV
ncbi:putative Transmembrane protein [Melia azedarach]|uniref:Transmembrane protein n=1 Tax=Melia azedarach TaxID=155640 RepID=A0ACC1YQL5_MELAZ|nr:putative Transmembrane protein [Melia azedarach]